MKVYVLHDCVDTSTEWAFSGVENVYANYQDAYDRMEALYEQYKAAYLDPDDSDGQEDTYIDGYGARVYDSIGAYRHTWTISKEEVV